MPEQCNHENGCSCQVAGAPMPPMPQGFAPPPPYQAAGSQMPMPPMPRMQMPSWAAAAVNRPSMRRGWRIGIATVVVAELIAAAVFITVQLTDDDGDSTTARTVGSVAGAADSGAGAASVVAGAAAGGADSAGLVASPGAGNLRKGAVFLQSNDQTVNSVVAFARNANGKLVEVGRYRTGGKGTGSFEDSSNGIVLGSAEGESSPNHNINDNNLLFVTNAGSGTITVFGVQPEGLERIGETPSGGNRPVSLTVNNGLLYVLNSGEVDRRLILGPTTALDNCTHDNLPSITGFRVTPDGTLQAIPGSTRLLSGVQRSGCAQLSFTPDGRHLVVTERLSGRAGDPTTEQGAIDIFDVQYDGTLGNRQINYPAGKGPFGFTFTKDGKLVTTEQNGALGNPGGGLASTYTINTDGTIKAISKAVPNRQTDTCWIALSHSKNIAYVSSPWSDGRISSYTVSPTGSLTLQHEVASAADGKDALKDNIATGATDLALSSDDHFLYQLNSFEGVLVVFKTQPNGLLTFVERHQVFALEPFGAGGEAAPFGLAVY